jgi:predicted transcriptional regulator
VLEDFWDGLISESRRREKGVPLEKIKADLVQREAIAAHVETGFAQAKRGELIGEDAATEILRQRRAERLRPQG